MLGSSKVTGHEIVHLFNIYVALFGELPERGLFGMLAIRGNFGYVSENLCFRGKPITRLQAFGGHPVVAIRI